MQKTLLVLLGVLIGVMLTVPVEAGNRKLERRVKKLEQKTAHLTDGGYLYSDYIDTPTGCGSDDPAEWDDSFAGLTC